MLDRTVSQADAAFVALCAVVYAVATLIIPPYIPLIEPDSSDYLAFLPRRSALYPAFLYVCKVFGLGLVQITWAQLAIFCLALSYLLVVLLRAGFARPWLGLFVAVLAGNVLFSSFHRSILTESLYFSLGTIGLALWIDYLRSGRARLLALAGLIVGLMIGFRPAGLALVPVQLLAAWIKRGGHTKWLLAVIAIVPLAVGIGAERLLYRAVHHAPADSTAHQLLMGKAAMLIEPGMTFSGPHAEALTNIGARVLQIMTPVRRLLDEAPSLAVRTQLSANYEGAAQGLGFVADELAQAAQQFSTTPETLRSELGYQVILQNLPGFIRETVLMDVGQWSVDARRYPPAARALAAYADANPGVLFGGVTADTAHVPPSRVALVVYPTFLAVGAVTLLLAFAFIAFIVRPSLLNTPAGFYWGMATFLSALCHGYTLFISLVNVWTPRFLMAVFPHLGVIALCLVMLALRHWRRGPAIYRDQADGGQPAKKAAA